jgi:hypothetical protein
MTMTSRKRNLPKLTAEELAAREANRKLARERAEFHRLMAEKLKEREKEQERLAS